MFEYLIYRNKKVSEGRITISRPKIKNSNFKQNYLQIGNLQLEILTNKPKDEFIYEDDEICLLILGTVYTKLDFENKSRRQLLPADLTKLQEVELQELRGHYHIIIIKKKSEEITVYNDLFGLKPLYYGENSTHVFIGNSLSVIKVFNPELDPSGLLEKVLFEHNLLDNTIYKGIFTLNEASLLRLNKTFSTKSYFSWYEYFSNARNRTKFNIINYITAFNSIVSSIASTKINNLVTLTGGHDGRAVLSSFLKQGFPVETFSFGRPGSENTKIPEDISRIIRFKHHSVYLLEEFENNYKENAKLTAYLSDGELKYSQQTILYAIQNLSLQTNYAYTGLLAGELVGPVHLLSDYTNPVYHKYIYLAEQFSLHKEIHPFNALLKNIDLTTIEQNILERIAIRKKKLLSFADSTNSHLTPLCDMITWGFRKFYGYQMHLARYHIENNPIFCDFDLMDMLINSDYNVTYINSYKSLYHRRNSRRLQLEIIFRNSRALSSMPLDRGYSPKEGLKWIFILKKLIKYFLRKRRIKKGHYTPDFLGQNWTDLILGSEFNYNDDSGRILNYTVINKKYGTMDKSISLKDITMISNLLFVNN
jgi:hypothetical protein